ncbi:unnamed protein product [Periconia digitata]|uniref:Uncharacterized protein n=1 Tax=Periconia digitata TaxID=1303443 RepID=A0A9W4U907_9PLEO|nr:unnamed protein product [Periconia digitata]
MQFATSVIALFASLAVAVPVLPNRPTVDNQFGAWLVNFSHDSNAREYLSSSFYPADFDPNHDNPSRNACVADPNATPAFEKRCDHLGFTYEFDVETGGMFLLPRSPFLGRY